MLSLLTAVDASRLPLNSSGTDPQDAAIARVVTLVQGWIVDQPQQVIQVVERQARQLLAQQDEIAHYQAQVAQLQQELQQVQGQPARSAAPFALAPEKRQKTPKRPGRPIGHRGVWRTPPPAADTDEQIAVQLAHCPDCGHPLHRHPGEAIDQTILELPVVEPRVIRLRTYRYACPGCAQTVHSHHPLQVSTATGAAGTHLGPRAIAVATALNKDFKLPLRKSCQILTRCFGLPLSPGGLAQLTERVAQRLEPQYEQALEALRQSDVLYTDETGWWLNGPGYTLWVFTNQDTTYYRIVHQRTRETARGLIGDDFAGVLVSDCLSIYDELNPLQHKCYAHHLKALSAALKTEAGKGSAYLLELRALLHSAQLLKQRMTTLTPAQCLPWRQGLEARMDDLLAQPRGHPHDRQRQQEEKLRHRLAKQRDHLFTFLDYPNVEATNNRAERQLRPAVISRKISCGNKTEAGATTWAILASLAATDQQQGNSFIDRVAQAMPLHSQP